MFEFEPSGHARDAQACPGMPSRLRNIPSFLDLNWTFKDLNQNLQLSELEHVRLWTLWACPGMPEYAQACPVGTNCSGNMACGYRPHFWEQHAHFWTQGPLLEELSVIIARLVISISKIAKLAVFGSKKSQKWRLVNNLPIYYLNSSIFGHKDLY